MADVANGLSPQIATLDHFFRTKADLAIAAFEMRWQVTQPELVRIFSPNKNSGAAPLDVQPLHL